MREALTAMTTRGRAFVAAGVTALLCAVALGQDDLVRVGSLLLLLPLVTAFFVGRSRYRLGLVRSVSPVQVEAGKEARVQLDLTNDGKVPTGLLLLEDQLPYVLGTRPRFVVDRMGPGRRRSVGYVVRSDVRGRYVVGPLSVRISDPFGLIELGRTFTSTTSLVVVPRVVPLPPIPLSGAWTGSGDNRPRAFASGSAEDVTVREYRRGDDLRRVHWRSSAHVGELMVRREEQPWQSRATLFLDNRQLAHRGRGAASSPEHAVSAAASVAVHLVQRGFVVRLVTADGDEAGGSWHERGSAAGETAPMLESLAVVQPAQRPDIDTRWLQDPGHSGLLVAVTGARRRPRQGAVLADAPHRGHRDGDRPRRGGVGRGGRRLRRPQRRRVPAGARLAERRRGPGDAAGHGVAGARPHHRPGRAAPGDLLGSPRMRRPQLDTAGTVVPAVLAALTSWLALFAWRGFVAEPSGYLDPMFASVALVAATGIVLRAFGARALVALAGQLVVVGLWLTHLWVPEHAVGGWVPTTTSTGEMLVLLGQGVAAAQGYAAPVPESAPQIHVLLVAAGTLVALLVDLVAVGLRRVPVAGLPLLAVYTAPLSILADGVAWWIFAAGAVGFLALIAAEETRRVQHWGRAVPRRDTVKDTSGGLVASTSLRSSARRIGFTATTLAVVSPLVVPTVSGGFLPGGPGGDGSGGSVTITNPMVNLRRDLVRGENIELLRVRTGDGNPAYLRISVLDAFDGLSWKPTDRDIPPEQVADGILPRPPGLGSDVARRQVRYEISVDEDFDSVWLPAPYPVTSIEAPGDWRYDTDTLDFVTADRDQSIAGMEYSLSALDITPSSERLVDAGPAPESIVTPYTDLPEDLPGTVAELARQVTGGAESRFEKAVALQRWFRDEGGFEYSLEPDPGTGADDLEAFLDEDRGRVGYCEQFAASMALMGRTLGIPSRVAVGFLRADPIGEDEYVYRAHDLHAWPEMYFEGAGWVRFEPTPDDRAQSVPGYTTGRLQTPQVGDAPSASPSANAVPQRAPEDRLRGEDLGAAGGQDSSGGGTGWWVLLAVGLFLLALSPWLARTLVQRRRWAGATTPARAAEAGWRELRDTVLDLRLPWDDSVTLRTRAAGVAAEFGRTSGPLRDGFVRGGTRGAGASLEGTAALGRLVVDVEQARYAREVTGERGRPVAAVRADVETCAQALAAGVMKKRRRAAVLLPASLWRNGAWRRALLARLPGRTPEVLQAGVDRAR